VSQCDPDADIEILEALAQEIEGELSRPESGMRMLQLIEDSFSNAIRVSDRLCCDSGNPEQELRRLISLYGRPNGASKAPVD
jgi:hypothetical protein